MVGFQTGTFVVQTNKHKCCGFADRSCRLIFVKKHMVRKSCVLHVFFANLISIRLYFLWLYGCMWKRDKRHAFLDCHFVKKSVEKISGTCFARFEFTLSQNIYWIESLYSIFSPVYWNFKVNSFNSQNENMFVIPSTMVFI